MIVFVLVASADTKGYENVTRLNAIVVNLQNTQ